MSVLLLLVPPWAAAYLLPQHAGQSRLRPAPRGGLDIGAGSIILNQMVYYHNEALNLTFAGSPTRRGAPSSILRPTPITQTAISFVVSLPAVSKHRDAHAPGWTGSPDVSRLTCKGDQQCQQPLQLRAPRKAPSHTRARRTVISIGMSSGLATANAPSAFMPRVSAGPSRRLPHPMVTPIGLPCATASQSLASFTWYRPGSTTYRKVGSPSLPSMTWMRASPRPFVRAPN